MALHAPLLHADARCDARPPRRSAAACWIWVLPILYVLWANLHIQFIYGLFVLGLAVPAPCIDRLIGRAESGRHADADGSRDWWQLVALTSACAGGDPCQSLSHAPLRRRARLRDSTRRVPVGQRTQSHGLPWDCGLDRIGAGRGPPLLWADGVGSRHSSHSCWSRLPIFPFTPSATCGSFCLRP